MKSTAWVPFSVCCTFVIFSACFVLGDYQNHGGDFGQYIIQARNLLLGRPWDFLLNGYPSPLPAYSAVLAVITKFFGINPYAYGLLNSFLWALCSLFSYMHFYRFFAAQSTAYVFLALVTFSPYVVGFQQSGVPNILFATSIMLALFISKNLSDDRPTWYVYLLFWLPAIIRTEAIVFYFSFILLFVLQRQWRRTIVPIVGIAIVVLLTGALQLAFNLVSNFEIIRYVTTSTTDSFIARNDTLPLLAFLQLSIQMFFGYLFELGLLMTAPTVISKISLIPFALCGLAALGMRKFKPGASFESIYLALQLLFLSGFLMPTGAEPRLLLPILPVFIFFIVYGLERNLASLNFGPRTVSAIIGIPFAILTTVSMPYQIARAARMNSLFTDEMSALADWLAKNQGPRSVAYYKARLLTMLLDLHAAESPLVLNFRTYDEAIFLLKQNAIVVVHKTNDFDQEKIRTQLLQRTDTSVLREDSQHTVFTMKTKLGTK